MSIIPSGYILGNTSRDHAATVVVVGGGRGKQHKESLAFLFDDSCRFA